MLGISGRFQSASLIFWHVVRLPIVLTEVQRLAIRKGMIMEASKDQPNMAGSGRADEGPVKNLPDMGRRQETSHAGDEITRGHADDDRKKPELPPAPDGDRRHGAQGDHGNGQHFWIDRTIGFGNAQEIPDRHRG